MQMYRKEIQNNICKIPKYYIFLRKLFESERKLIQRQLLINRKRATLIQGRKRCLLKLTSVGAGNVAPLLKVIISDYEVGFLNFN